MWLTRTVFRCFKCVERTAERVTGAVGPLFIGIAVILIGIGIFSFFDIIAPTLRWRFITTPICAVIALNTVANYYWAITVPPGFADQDIRLSGHRRSTPIGHWERWTTAPMHTPPRGSEFMRSHELEPGKVGKCQKCGSIKPERTHHCRICKRCVLKYDHHCPVSLRAMDYDRELTILSVAYLITCCGFLLVLGLPTAFEVIGMVYNWPHRTPRVMFLLIYIIALALGLAVGAMLSWHLYLISKGQTSVENHDFGTYRKLAKNRGQTFVNSYDLGARKNFALFFNITPTGHPWWVLLTPFRTKPYANGHAWARRPGFEGGHAGIQEGEELTDEEDD